MFVFGLGLFCICTRLFIEKMGTGSPGVRKYHQSEVRNGCLYHAHDPTIEQAFYSDKNSRAAPLDPCAPRSCEEVSRRSRVCRHWLGEFTWRRAERHSVPSSELPRDVPFQFPLLQTNCRPRPAARYCRASVESSYERWLE